MDHSKLIQDLITNNFKLSIDKIKKLSIKYNKNIYNFDDFIKEYHIDNDCSELFDNLTERGYIFDDHMVKNYMARTTDGDNISWYINNKKDDSYLVNPILHCDSPDYDLFETLLQKNLNPNFDDIDELCFRAPDVIKTYKILLEYGYKFDHHKYNKYVLYQFMKSLASALKYHSDKYYVQKVYNHPEVKKYFGKEINITKKDIERGKELYGYFDTDKIFEVLPADFPKFSSKYNNHSYLKS